MSFRHACLLGLCLGVIFTSSAHSEELFPRQEIKLGYQGMYMYYDEPRAMYEEGFMNGGFASWTGYFTNENIMLGVEAEGLAGRLHYAGGYSDGRSIEVDDDDAFLSARITVGKGYTYDGIGLTPYSGVALRYWFDDINASGGYERNITQAYLPIGVKLVSPIDEDWTVGGALEGDLLLIGTVKSHLTDVGSDYSDVMNTQGFLKGAGARVSAYVERHYDGYSLGVEPYFRYWQFPTSRTDSVFAQGKRRGMVEPLNLFFMSGVRLYVKF